MYSVSMHVPSPYCVLGTVLGDRDTEGKYGV